jgi:UDP-GlcNAc:undecaprenyl-phosphate GlcNAc-1-phosphate transferase
MFTVILIIFAALLISFLLVALASNLFRQSFQQRRVMINNIRIHNSIGELRSVKNFSELLDRMEECFQALNFCRVELRMPRENFPECQSHRHFIICAQKEEMVALWLNKDTKLASRAEDDTVELRMPFQCPGGMATISFSHICQSEPLLFDINLLFNNLRIKLEQAILHKAKSAPVVTIAKESKLAALSQT